MTKTNQLIKALKESNEDWNFYPTTQAIINVIKAKCKTQYQSHNEEDIFCSVLDCGAGDGRVLMALTSGKRYAIEKAVPLIQAMDCDIILVLPESLKTRLLHLIADGKVKSIQAAILESLENFIESKEKEGL